MRQMAGLVLVALGLLLFLYADRIKSWYLRREQDAGIPPFHAGRIEFFSSSVPRFILEVGALIVVLLGVGLIF